MITLKRNASAALDALFTAAIAAALVALLAAILLIPAAAFASPEIAKKEAGMKCTVCHDKAGSKLMTDKGKYYEAVRSMAGYDEVIAQYKTCTACHSKEPGDLKLTPEGEKHKAKGETMKHIAKPEAK